MGPLSTQRVTPLPSPHVWQGHSQGPPCLPAGGAASVSPSPLHPAPLAPARREAIDPAPAAAIVLVSGASAAPSPAWPREDHPSQARPIEVTVGGVFPVPPHAPRERRLGQATSLRAGVDPAAVSWDGGGGGAPGGLGAETDTEAERQEE